MVFKTIQISHSTILILIFCVVFISHLESPVITSGDSMFFIPTAMSIIKEGNTNLDEYQELLERGYGYKTFNGHIYPFYPIGVALIAVPFVLIIDEVSDKIFDFNLYEYIKHTFPEYLEVFIASFIVALTAVFIYLIAYNFFRNKKYSILLAFIFAYCTSAWSTASRALWQHGPSMLMLTISLYLILLAKSRPWLIQFTSLPLAFSYLIRPTNSISIALLTVFVLIQYRKYFLRYLLWAMVIAVPFLVYNLSIYYPSFLSPYYQLGINFLVKTRLWGEAGKNQYFWGALAGHIISPSRGLFIFSPILLFSIYGVILKIKNKQLDKLDYFLIGIILLHWISMSAFPQWWAGRSFGPRYLSDITPYFIYFLIPAVGSISKSKGMKKGVFASIFFCFIIISFFIHYRGATSWDTYWSWYKEPAPLRYNQERIWDWHDPQFLRGIINPETKNPTE